MKRIALCALLASCTPIAAPESIEYPAVQPIPSGAPIIVRDISTESFHCEMRIVDTNRDGVPEYTHYKTLQDVGSIHFESDTHISQGKKSFDVTTTHSITFEQPDEYTVDGRIIHTSPITDIRTISFYQTDTYYDIHESFDHGNDNKDISVKMLHIEIDSKGCIQSYEETYSCDQSVVVNPNPSLYPHCPYTPHEWDTHNNIENKPLKVGDCNIEEKVLRGITIPSNVMAQND